MNGKHLNNQRADETAKKNEDFSEIKFSMSKIFIANINQLSSLLRFENNEDLDAQNKKISLKLKFYSISSNCKLKEKNIKASIVKNESMPKDSCFISCKNKSVNLKVMFPTHEQFQILGKVYVIKKKSEDSSEVMFKLLGSFKVNLLEWMNEAKRQSPLTYSQNPQSSNLIKKVEFQIFTGQQQHKSDGYEVFSSSFEQNRTPNRQKNNQTQIIEHTTSMQSPDPQITQQLFNFKKSYIQFKIYPLQTINFFFKSLQQNPLTILSPKLKRLHIINGVVNEMFFNNRPQTNNFNQSPKIKIFSPQKQLLSKISRARSQMTFKRFVSNKKNQENNVEQLEQSIILKDKRPFKDKIYELLQQVRLFKKGFQIEKKMIIKRQLEYKAKKVYPILKPQIYQLENEYSSQKINLIQRNRSLNNFIPLSLVNHGASGSQLLISSTEKSQIQKSFETKARMQKVIRLQKRLQSYEKMRKLSYPNYLKTLSIK